MKRKMSEHGAALQTYNMELVKCLEDLKIRKKEVMNLIEKEETEKRVMEKNLKSLQEKLHSLNSSLQHHKSLCENYDKTIKETEQGFKKILESSQALLHLAQHEANKLDTSQNKSVV